MPELVRLYIRNIVFGMLLAVVFTGLLIGFNVANLRHLTFETSGGYLAILLLLVFNSLVFAGVQFAIAVMRMAQPDDTPRGGKRAPVVTGKPAPALAPSTRR